MCVSLPNVCHYAVLSYCLAMLNYKITGKMWLFRCTHDRCLEPRRMLSFTLSALSLVSEMAVIDSAWLNLCLPFDRLLCDLT